MSTEVELSGNAWNSFQPQKAYCGLVHQADGAQMALMNHMESIVPPGYRWRVVFTTLPIVPGLPLGGYRWEYDGRRSDD